MDEACEVHGAADVARCEATEVLDLVSMPVDGGIVREGLIANDDRRPEVAQCVFRRANLTP